MEFTDKHNYLLKGKPGLLMKADALDFAMKYLNMEQIYLHPDFLMIEKSVNKSFIGVDDAARITERAAIRPNIVGKHLIIIDGIDCMTVAAQNKLLKILEDSENIFVIAISYGNSVLDTIISRMAVIEYHALTRDNFYKKWMTLYPAFDPELYFQITHGCMNAAEWLLEYDNLFKKLRDCIQKQSFLNLFSIFHLVREKDKEAVTENHRLIPYIISFMQEEYIKSLTKACTSDMNIKLYSLKILEEHRLRCEIQGYSKDDFFNLIVHLTESNNIDS